MGGGRAHTQYTARPSVSILSAKGTAYRSVIVIRRNHAMLAGWAMLADEADRPARRIRATWVANECGRDVVNERQRRRQSDKQHRDEEDVRREQTHPIPCQYRVHVSHTSASRTASTRAAGEPNGNKWMKGQSARQRLGSARLNKAAWVKHGCWGLSP